MMAVAAKTISVTRSSPIPVAIEPRRVAGVVGTMLRNQRVIQEQRGHFTFACDMTEAACARNQ